MHRRWFVIQTRPNEERRAAESVRNLAGFETWLPTFVMQRFRAVRPSGNGRRRFPLFPGYLFVSLDPALEDHRFIDASCPGVRRLMRNPVSFEPIAVPDGTVEALRQRPELQMDDLRAPIRIPRGARVRVLDGPFVDLTGVCLRSGPERVAVLLELLGRASRIELPRGSVEQLGEHDA